MKVEKRLANMIEVQCDQNKCIFKMLSQTINYRVSTVKLKNNRSQNQNNNKKL